MSTYFEIIDRLLLEKTGKRACELDYMELPQEDERYNISRSIGNIHLVAGRIKTPKKREKLIDKLMKSEMP